MKGSNSAANPDKFVADTNSAALSDQEFASLMVPMAPFEPNPALAIAVSGGADSLCLALLASRWAATLGGSITALTLDHGLRSESGAETEQVGAWMQQQGIAHAILRWQPPPTLQNIQATARQARYRLLGDWCRARGVFHLLTAHHRDDQAETLLLRLERGSGLYGLASMPPVDELPHYRLLRPLLAIPSTRLKATLKVWGQDWLEDPSNLNQRFARVRVRNSALLHKIGLKSERLAETARHLGRSRVAEESVVEDLLARSALLDPSGFITLDWRLLQQSATDIRLRALSSVITTASGEDYPPRFAALERLDQAICTGRLGSGKTLSGCRIVPAGNGLLIYRELRAIAAPVLLPEQGEIIWDRRYLITVGRLDRATGHNIYVGALEQTGIAQFHAIVGRHFASHVPKKVMPTLPGFLRNGRLIFAPYLKWSISGMPTGIEIRFRPSRPLAGGGFVSD